MIEKQMRVAPLTNRERQYVEELIAAVGGRRSIRSKQCWKNVQRLILEDGMRERRLRYCERGFPIPHAWVTINGKVVDVTREAADRWLKRHGIAQDVDHTYAGVVISRHRVLNHIKRTKMFSPVVDWSHILMSERGLTEAGAGHLVAG